MAHNINIEDGKASMMYIGRTPWHGLGTQLSNPATSAEAIKAANLNWKVTKKRLYAFDGDAMLKSDKYAMVREDKWGNKDCKILGVVSDAYTPVQNTEAFEFFDEIVGQKKAIYHTAGALGNGERIWILAKLPGNIVVTGEDVVNKYLLLANGHDGTLSVQVKFTPVRVVCQNTLTIALSSDEQGVKIPHSRDVKKRLSTVAETLGIINARFGDIEAVFQEMAKKDFNEAALKNYHEKVFPLPKKIKNESDERKQKAMLEMREYSAFYFKQGVGNDMKEVNGTLWAAYNGITEYIDHHKQLKNGTDKLSYIWFGGGQAIKARAYNEAAELMKQ